MNSSPPHTVSKDELIGTLLQLWRADCPLALSNRPEQVVQQLGFDEEGEEARCKKNYGGEPSTQLKLIRQYLATAEQLDRMLTGAIDSQRQKTYTGLLVIKLHAYERDPEQYEAGYFTTSSAYLWANDEFNIQIAKWAPAEHQTEPADKTGSTPKKSSAALEHNEIEKLEVIIALFLMQLASGAGEKFGSIEKPNYQQASNLIRDVLKSQRIDIMGLSDTGMRRKLSRALKTARRYTAEK